MLQAANWKSKKILLFLDLQENYKSQKFSKGKKVLNKFPNDIAC